MMQIFLFDQGSITARIDGKEIHLSEGEFLYVPSLCVHGFEFKPDTSGLVISVLNAVGAAVHDLKTALSVPIHGQTPGDMTAIADLLVSVRRSQGAFRTQRAIGLAQALLGMVAETGAVSDTTRRHDPKSKLLMFDQLIADHMEDGWSASRFASAMAMTTGHLSRLSRAATGLGATAYIEKKTMEEACRLLAFTQLSISEVGYRVGYSDPSYFTKRFQKAMHQSPTKYRSNFVD